MNLYEILGASILLFLLLLCVTGLIIYYALDLGRKFFSVQSQ